MAESAEVSIDLAEEHLPPRAYDEHKWSRFELGVGEAVRALHLPKVVEFQKRVKSRLHHLIFHGNLSLYDQCLFAFALHPAVEEFLMAQLQAACHWAILLSGSQFCAEVQENRRIILSLRKFISLGNDQKGDEHVDSFIRTALTISSTPVEPLNNLIALLQAYKDDHQTGEQWLFHRSWTGTVRILSLVSNICFLHHKSATQVYPTPMETGECWKTVFDDLYTIDLSTGFNDLDLLHVKLPTEYFPRQRNSSLHRYLEPVRKRSMNILRYFQARAEAVANVPTVAQRNEPLLRPVSVLDRDFVSIYARYWAEAIPTVDIELSELLYSIGAETFGRFGNHWLACGQFIAIEVGVERWQGTRIWHILSREEIVYLWTNEEEFSKMLEIQKEYWGIEGDRISEPLEFSSDLVRVGCLIEPTECAAISLEPLAGPTVEESFRNIADKHAQFTNAVAKFGRHLKRNIAVGANLEVDLGPVAPVLNGSKLSMGTKISPDHDQELQRKLFNAQRRTFYDALRQPIFLYETVTGEVCEQNLWCFVNRIIEQLSLPSEEAPTSTFASITARLANVLGVASTEAPKSNRRALWNAELERMAKINILEKTDGYQWLTKTRRSIEICQDILRPENVVLTCLLHVKNGAIGGLDFPRLLLTNERARVTDISVAEVSWMKAKAFRDPKLISLAVPTLPKNDEVRLATERRHKRGTLTISAAGLRYVVGEFKRLGPQNTGPPTNDPVRFAANGWCLKLTDVFPSSWAEPDLYKAAERSAGYTWQDVYVAKSATICKGAQMAVMGKCTEEPEEAALTLTEYLYAGEEEPHTIGLMIEIQ